MDLIDIDETRVTHLVQLHRPSGQLYLPEAVAKLAARYEFAKFPVLNDLVERRESFSFNVGKFRDAQIQAFRIYTDGLVAESRSNSKIIDAFLDDVLHWASDSLGVKAAPTSAQERHHESALVVRSEKDLAKAMRASKQIATKLNELLHKENYPTREFHPSGLIFSADTSAPGSRRKETRFMIDRRVEVPFSESLFFSLAPLPTDDHLDLLTLVEDLVD
jgi:hypothetical protein